MDYEPELVSTCDAASAAGAGGIWVGYQVQPTVWRLEWPKDVVQLYHNGALTNSDLELIGVLLQWYIVAEQIRTMNRCHTAIWSDNFLPATTGSWATKIGDKATTPITDQLLWALVMRQRTTHSTLPSMAHYAGSRNVLAHTASRWFAKFHHGKAWGLPSHSDIQFLI